MGKWFSRRSRNCIIIIIMATVILWQEEKAQWKAREWMISNWRAVVMDLVLLSSLPIF